MQWAARQRHHDNHDLDLDHRDHLDGAIGSCVVAAPQHPSTPLLLHLSFYHSDMPRDLPAPSATTSTATATSSLVLHRDASRMHQQRLAKAGVRPFAQLLNRDDLDDCDWLEHAAFDPIEAASRAKVARHFLLVDHLLLLPSHLGLRQALGSRTTAWSLPS